MSNVLDFNKARKQYFTVTLPDEDKTTILISTPGKTVMEELLALGLQFKDIDEDSDLDDGIDQIMGDLYNIVAKVMSFNKTGVKITKEKIEDCLGFDDIVLFFNSYLDFIKDIKNSKN